MLAGIVITNGLKGLKEKFCSSNILNKKMNNEGAYAEVEFSIIAGVMKITRNRMKISLKYFLLITAIIEQIKSEHSK